MKLKEYVSDVLLKYLLIIPYYIISSGAINIHLFINLFAVYTAERCLGIFSSMKGFNN